MPDPEESVAPLKEWRKRRYFSIRDLAKAADVPTATIVDAERGRRTPHGSTIRAIAMALGVDPGDIDGFAIQGDDDGDAADQHTQ